MSIHRNVVYLHRIITKEKLMCSRTECLDILTKASSYIRDEFGVKSMQVFGSFARGDNHPGSDVDVFVDMPPRIFLMSALREYLEKILDSSVDLIRKHSNLSEKFINQLSKDAVTIF